MPELRIEENSPTLQVTFVEAEKPNRPKRNLGMVGHPVAAGQSIDWENCGIEAIKQGGKATGIRVKLATK